MNKDTRANGAETGRSRIASGKKPTEMNKEEVLNLPENLNLNNNARGIAEKSLQ